MGDVRNGGRPRRFGSVSARAERGAAAVEFALVLPLLLAVVFGIINFGFVMSQKAALSNAARAGARYATVNAYSGTHTCQSVVDKVRAEALTLGIGDGNKNQVAVDVTFTDQATGVAATVCSTSAGSASVSFGGASLPCRNTSGSPSAPDQLAVTGRFESPLPVPTPGLGSSVTLTGSSSFVCEYYE